MFESLIFNQTGYKPTRDKKDYVPYPVREIAIVGHNTLRLTCQDAKAADHCAKWVASVLTARHVSMNDEFEFKRGEIDIRDNQFTLEGDLRGLIGVLAQGNCISNELRDSIYKDTKFCQLSPEKPSVQYDEDELTGFSPELPRKPNQKAETRDILADLIKTHKPELWDTLSTSPEKEALLEALVSGLKEVVSETTPRNNRSPSIHVK